MSGNQNQLYIFTVVALVIGLIIGYFVSGAMGGGAPTGDEELLSQISALEADVERLEDELESM